MRVGAVTRMQNNKGEGDKGVFYMTRPSSRTKEQSRGNIDTISQSNASNGPSMGHSRYRRSKERLKTTLAASH